MRSVYFHLVGGAAGDMLLSSLIGLGCPLKLLKKEFAKLPVKFRIQEKNSGGHVPKKRLFFQGDSFTYYQDIVRVIRASKLDKDVKDEALRVYALIAAAEGRVHKPAPAEDSLHFGHLGEIDAVLEICGFFLALKYLKIDRVYTSAFPLSCPAPATLEILKTKQIIPAAYGYESVTPTAAALLLSAAQSQERFCYQDCAWGWGQAGPADYLVAYLREEDFTADEIVKIEVNIDDSSPQVFESLFSALYEQGAKEVYLEQVLMKKMRPAVVLNVLTLADDFCRVRDVIFAHTSTFGIRYQTYRREKLKYEFIRRETEFGKMKFRVSLSPVKKQTPEYADCLAVARKFKIPLQEVYRQITRQER